MIHTKTVLDRISKMLSVLFRMVLVEGRVVFTNSWRTAFPSLNEPGSSFEVLIKMAVALSHAGKGHRKREVFFVKRIPQGLS